MPQSGARRGQALQAEAQGRRLEGKVFRDPSGEGGEGSAFLKLRSRNGGGGVGINAGPALLVPRYKEVVLQAGEVLSTERKEDV